MEASERKLIPDHFVDVTEMAAIGSGAEHPVRTVLLSRYASCYLTKQSKRLGKTETPKKKKGE
jgi:hypothetical protein